MVKVGEGVVKYAKIITSFIILVQKFDFFMDIDIFWGFWVFFYWNSTLKNK
jgi:hypothetical protein